MAAGDTAADSAAVGGAARSDDVVAPANSTADRSSASKDALTLISLPLVIVLAPFAIVLDLLMALLAILLFLVRILVRFRPVFLSMRKPRKRAYDDADSKVFERAPQDNEPLPQASKNGIEDALLARKKEIAAQHRMGTGIAGFIPNLVESAKASVDNRLDAVDVEVERRKANAREYQADAERRLRAAGMEDKKTGSWRAYVAVMILLAGASAPLDFEAFRHNFSFDWEVILFTVLAGAIWVLAAHVMGHYLKEHLIISGTPRADGAGNALPKPKVTPALVLATIFAVLLAAMLYSVNSARVDSLNEASTEPRVTSPLTPAETDSNGGVVDLGGN